MKRMIRSADNLIDDPNEYIPRSFDKNSVESILRDLDDAVQGKFSKRYKQMSVEFEDIFFKGNTMKAKVILYNNGLEKKSKLFEFSAYFDYWDISDYQQHVAMSIQKFVDSL